MLSVLVTCQEDAKTYIFVPVAKRLKVITSLQDFAGNAI